MESKTQISRHFDCANTLYYDVKQNRWLKYECSITGWDRCTYRMEVHGAGMYKNIYLSLYDVLDIRQTSFSGESLSNIFDAPLMKFIEEHTFDEISKLRSMMLMI